MPTEVEDLAPIYIKKPIGSPTDPISHDGDQDDLGCQSHPSFWTSAAVVTVDWVGPRLERRYGAERLNIRDKNGNTIGCMYLNTTWRREQPDNLEIIVICCYVSEHSQYWDPGVIVILIEWEDQVSFRVQRVDTAIDQEAWAMAKPEWKFITLG